MTDHKTLRERAEAAGNKSWKMVEGHDRIFIEHEDAIPSPYNVICILGENTFNYTQRKHDAAFIAAANPQAVIALLDEIEQLKADHHDLQEAHRHLRIAGDHQEAHHEVHHAKEKELLDEVERLRNLFAVYKPITDHIVDLVNGWQRDPKAARHPKNLGITLKTKAGVCYDIFDAQSGEKEKCNDET